MTTRAVKALDRRRWLQRAARYIAALAAPGLLAACGAAGEAERLPPYAYRNEIVLAAYRYAVAEPELLSKLVCYCGCGPLVGHQNLRDCFRSATGRFDEHAANCQTCLDEALDAKRLQAEGRSVPEIRRVIDDTYRGRGTPTNTPPVE